LNIRSARLADSASTSTLLSFSSRRSTAFFQFARGLLVEVAPILENVEERRCHEPGYPPDRPLAQGGRVDDGLVPRLDAFGALNDIVAEGGGTTRARRENTGSTP
jgi:hypothetical protein